MRLRCIGQREPLPDAHAQFPRLNPSEEIPCPPDEGRAAELKSLQAAIDENRAPFLDGRWGKATLEVCLAMLQSSQERREITLSHQIPSVDVKVPAVEAKVKVEA